MTNQKRGPCAKQQVLAILKNKDKIYIGKNDCATPQKVCPRCGMESGVGYHLCKEVCRQECHAEIDACLKAGKDAKGALMVLYGINYCCSDCIVVMKQYEVWAVLLVDNNYELLKLNGIIK